MLDVVEGKMTTDYELYLESWILNNLSVPQRWLNNMPSCPFAQGALIRNKVKFIRSHDYVKDLEKHLSNWDENYEVLVIVCDDDVNSEKLSEDVKKINEKFVPLGYVSLEDHVDCQEAFKDIVFNNGRYNIIICQPAEQLETATKQLEKHGYYEHWPKEYYNEVFAWRGPSSS